MRPTRKSAHKPKPRKEHQPEPRQQREKGHKGPISTKNPQRLKQSNAQAHRRSPSAGEDFWIYGRHAVTAALGNPRRNIQRLMLTREAESTLEVSFSPSLKPEIVGVQEIAALLPPGAVHQGIALLADPLPAIAIEDVIARVKNNPQATIVVLDQVTDPRNVGAIMRSAAAFGAEAVILPERNSAGVSPTLAKAASGALETVLMARVTNIKRALELLKKEEFWCIGLDGGAKTAIGSVDLSGRVVLVMGSEGRGLRRLVAQSCDVLASLPISSAMESLNVSAAAAIALYEAARKRS
ncbi:MAG: 23S rRNA (guanosine(2251)-2'-O)-methyltransferase RlmB [Rhodospirillales bacterium]|jgi:23S rRNA (guanosine2251-2'-O)-methyltransferase|nr:23S rRNA (guanosine(2251)-2'-O)-methyltransferase RlmB [Rhodospirillales bacterium]MBT4005758.1 23S rRNA (guanosine(2251)-2'-O)-methyltransferase RlmB [Rhodospirillales bacterium]MBT5113413.1 23S rRNA (guanosine(2251)-2'-O)-methyltransferase RlmB [Rhodospirillales bacterium]MBT5672239.1 23S rRNA (guanosine(2251)-2'-O)-methyltransferase RlmB [Rhodospirillales bacterium]MBT6187192.1 23S rRNA (guanosine(2251)-2'-O)-methyltransferase RlmB [Rhodospirillales bacterium]